MPRSPHVRLLSLARTRKLFTADHVAEAGIHSQELTRLVASGEIERVARGCYRLAEAEVTEHHGLARTALVAPRGVICLISALTFHGIGTQLPSTVWLAIERGQRAPREPGFPLTIVRYGGRAFRAGIEVHLVEGQKVRVYGVAKTLADLFKARNRVGLDVALEALREAWRERRFTIPELERTARVCRVERVLRPYLEAIVA